MNIELIKDIYNLHIKGFEGLDFNVIHKDNYEITYNENIKDCYSNFISNFDVKNNQEFERIISEADKVFSNKNRNTAIYLIPFMKELYNNRDKYFTTDKFELISTEVWQIYQDFSKLDNINTNCKLDVKLELAKDMEEYANYLMSSYQTDDENDPYGDLDEGYRQGFYPHKMYKKFGFEDLCVVYYYLRCK